MESKEGDEGVVCREGAQWVGASHLGREAFHEWFGVYPYTAVFLSHLCGMISKDLLKVLWWMRQYPRRRDLTAKRVGPSRFVQWVWATMRSLDSSLPVVCLSLIEHNCLFYAFFFLAPVGDA
jgi:hypothetical protein